MITLIIFTIIGLIIGLQKVFYSTINMGFSDWIEVIFASFFWCFIGLLAGLCFAIALPAKTTETLVAKLEIVSIQDNQSTNGSYFLGTGYNDGKMCFTFYQSLPDGGRNLVQVNAYKAKIYDNLTTDKPYCLQYKHKPTKAFINLFAYDFYDDRYEIYVPKGTIKENFILDAQ